MEQKLEKFLFKGREDVFAIRRERDGKSGCVDGVHYVYSAMQAFMFLREVMYIQDYTVKHDC